MSQSPMTSDAAGLRDLLTQMVTREASDLHLLADYKPMYRIHGALAPAAEDTLEGAETASMIHAVVPETLREAAATRRDLDFSIAIDHASGRIRFRVNVFQHEGHLGACFRLIPAEIPSLEWLTFPADLADRIVHQPHGLVLFTGVTGSGKSSSMAALVDILNQEGGFRIITIEEPIEYVFPCNDRTVISQREVGVDVPTFYDGLKFGLRQDPDVILVGEIRDRETAQMALSASETGHLILATLHTRDAKGAITRMVDLFPHDAQEDVRGQLSMSLRYVLAQHLLPAAELGQKRVLALEVMYNNTAVASAIRMGKIENLETAIQTGRRDGMFTLDDHLARLTANGRITMATARRFAKDPEGLTAWVPRDNRQCAKCGYDLTGLQDTRCPECGTPFGRGPLPKLRSAR